MSHYEETIEQCLELVAQRSENIAPMVYQYFFSRHPEAEVLFGIDDYDAYKNEMVVSLLQELMNFSTGDVYRENIQRWILDHKAYGVTLPMYSTMLSALAHAMKELLGADWTAEMSEAWQAQFNVLEPFLTRIYSDGFSIA
ncbi:MAG: globin [Porticoccaceae bacterium]|nr:globin [Pseudomonadales bacterium]MCP5172302.1 globin [Pseudomonadales bacterium]